MVSGTAESMSDHGAYLQAQAALDEGASRLSAGRAEEAIARLQEGLAALGDRYRTPDLIDDTGMKLLAAEDNQRAGRTPEAAEVMRRVLAARLSLYRQKHGLPTPP